MSPQTRSALAASKDASIRLGSFCVLDQAVGFTVTFEPLPNSEFRQLTTLPAAAPSPTLFSSEMTDACIEDVAALRESDGCLDARLDRPKARSESASAAGVLTRAPAA